MPSRIIPPESVAESSYAGIDMLEVLAEAVHYNAYLISLVEASLRRGDKAIDFGAGAGTFAKPVRDRGVDVICVEPDPTLKARLERDGFQTFASLDDIADESVDYVYTLNVIEHIADDAGTLRALASKLKPRGRMLVYVPAFQSLFSAFDEKYGHLRRYRLGGLTRLVTGAGLHIRNAAYVDSVGYAAALFYRAFGGGKGELSSTTIKLYDSWVFPLSRVLDRPLGRFVGKNVFVLAEKPAA